MNGIKLRGTGRCVPANTVTNDDLSRLVDTSDEWITARTGIQQPPPLHKETLTELCVSAARDALHMAGITPADIGVCIVATVSADTVVPSAACLLQRALGLPEDTPCFDLNAACTGFVYALHTMECLLNASPRKFGLVVGAEALSRVVDWTDRGTCILFGDGAAAAVVECREGWPSIGAVLGSRGDDVLLRLPGVEPEAKRPLHGGDAGVQIRRGDRSRLHGRHAEKGGTDPGGHRLLRVPSGQRPHH
ncbi:MAG: hypothetical protein ACLSHO_12675 [Dysosmobacter sp.]